MLQLLLFGMELGVWGFLLFVVGFVFGFFFLISHLIYGVAQELACLSLYHEISVTYLCHTACCFGPMKRCCLG